MVSAQRISGNNYIIQNIRAGVYQFSVPDSNLPLEYQDNDLQKPIIKVSNTARTVVPIHLQKTLGISGKLIDEKEKVNIVVYKEGKVVKKSQTNVYGYYQIIGLPAGKYTVKADGYKPRKIVISDDFLFDIDLALFDADSDSDYVALKKD